MLMGTVLAAAIGVSGAGASHSCSEHELGWSYCGLHVRADALPLTFRVNTDSRPAGLGSRGVLRAVESAVAEWNAHWPAATGRSGCELLCVDGVTQATGAKRDGVNTISWAPFGACGDGHADGVAVACLWFEGSEGAAKHRIAEVDIILNPTRAWYQPGGARAALGDVAGLYPELADTSAYNELANGQGKYDLQSALTHELGHAVGLEDIGSETPWPGSLISDATEYRQTMYRWYYRGTTNKRSLAEGDIAGLWRVAMDTTGDGG